MKVGMTGNRNGIFKEAFKVFTKFMTENKIDEAHHGDCIGADTEFNNLVCKNTIIVIQPPNIDTMRSFNKGDV